MSEEHERMEINDSALEGVSGGYDTPNTAVVKLCPVCQKGISLGYQHCTGGFRELEQYLWEHGVDSVKHNIDCPFYRRGKGEGT